jgi:putative transport protein
MEIDISEILTKSPTLLTFLVIGLGYLIGNIRIGPMDIGSTTGVLLTGLLLGHLGFPSSSAASSFGFSLFIFSVGLQAGPSFFSALAEDGRKYVVLAVVVSVTALSLAITFGNLFQFKFGFNAGMLAGGLTSTPTLAGAQDAISSGLANIPEGMTTAQALNNISVAYAITYIFGTIGLILFIRFFPVLLKIDLPAEARALAEKKGIGKRRGGIGNKAKTLPIIRAYRVDSEITANKTITQRRAELGLQITPLRVRRGHEFLDPDPDMVLQKGDIISVIGSLKDHQDIQQRIGQEVLDQKLLNYQISSKEVVAIHQTVVGKPIRDLKATAEHGCFITGLTRASIDLPVEDNVVIHKGDRLHVIGEEEHLRKLAEKVGHIEEEIEETDLISFSFGIVFGILLGMVLVKFGNISIGLGSAGGLLITGILIGFFSSMRPTFGRVPAAARFILMEIGLMLFMTSVGLKAGAGIWAALLANGPVIIGSGILVTLVPALTGYAFGHFILKLNPVLLLGSLTGAMTSTPSLKIVTSAAKSSIPALGYAGTYTFANVFLTFSGTIIMMI